MVTKQLIGESFALDLLFNEERKENEGKGELCRVMSPKASGTANTTVAIGCFLPPDESTPPPGRAFCQMSSPAGTRRAIKT